MDVSRTLAPFLESGQVASNILIADVEAKYACVLLGVELELSAEPEETILNRWNERSDIADRICTHCE